MVDWQGRMLNIPRTKNEEPLNVSVNDVAMAALGHSSVGELAKAECSKSARTGEPLENGRH